MKHFSFIFSVFLTVCLVILSMAGCGSGEGSAQNQTGPEGKVSIQKAVSRAAKVSIAVIEPTPIRDVIILPGEIKAWQDVRVSASMGGKVEWIGPKEGQIVKKGDLVAKINVSVLKVSLKRAEAAFKLADKVYRRLKRLHKQNIVTQESLDKASTERTLALGTLRQLQVQYDEGFVRAPITGQVNKLYVDAGEFVGPGTPILDLVNINRLKVEVNIPEMDVRYIKTGQKAIIRVDAFKNRIIEGIVSFVAYKADPATRTFRETVAIENLKRDIRAGMLARVVLVRRQVPDALVVPLSALLNKNGEYFIFVEENGVARMRTVSLGVIERDRVQITKGLHVGDYLIVSGHQGLEEGMRVQVQ